MECLLSLKDLKIQNPLFEFLELLDTTNAHIILLRGDLGSGKTTFVQHFAQKYHITNITSPTFSFMTSYDHDHISIYHYDLYRYALMEALELGVLEEFSKTGFHFIEWGEKDLEQICLKVGIISLFKLEIKAIEGSDKRYYRIEACIP